eukprot:CAMPEP_0169265424 /NCGR_PEP_ID=MMETSP1016-20121227/45761_1 /TAXON_ID=342587 /ORGANISM="Karlodinium micrum, Strain CCMP2283" /LENGTH=135 /DNA_ID=CAMNT_0009349071 /DNA_START=3 /DNA_END=407 /DNA_ORIENTATION=-
MTAQAAQTREEFDVAEVLACAIHEELKSASGELHLIPEGVHADETESVRAHALGEEYASAVQRPPKTEKCEAPSMHPAQAELLLATTASQAQAAVQDINIPGKVVGDAESNRKQLLDVARSLAKRMEQVDHSRLV